MTRPGADVTTPSRVAATTADRAQTDALDVDAGFLRSARSRKSLSAFCQRLITRRACRSTQRAQHHRARAGAVQAQLGRRLWVKQLTRDDAFLVSCHAGNAGSGNCTDGAQAAVGGGSAATR